MNSMVNSGLLWHEKWRDILLNHAMASSVMSNDVNVRSVFTTQDGINLRESVHGVE